MTLVWAILSRKRKRSKSRSPSRSRSPPLLHRRRDASLSWSRPVRDSFRFVYRIYGYDVGFKWFKACIPTEDLKFFNEVEPDIYTRHDHHCCDPTRFRRTSAPIYLGHNPSKAVSSIPVAGSHAYGFYAEDLNSDLDFWSYYLEYESPRLLLPPLCRTRYFFISFSLRRKIYIWGGLGFIPNPLLPTQDFAEVYDPETELWSVVPQPPNVDVLIRRSSLFIVSLGDLEGKVMVFDYDTPDPMFYFYDVVAEQWTTQIPPRSLHFEPSFIFQKAVINEDDHNLYWIDSRYAFLYALDWKGMELFSGPIVGMEHVPMFANLEHCTHDVLSLHHLRDEFFCLLWCEVTSFAPNTPTNFHFTFLKVVKGRCRGSLTAFVIGCFMDSDIDIPIISDAVLA
ncbi:hypothetical protein RND81_13G168100 [Saponaria officinalis]|uniref:Uncharacterized protein n=1 Tax=Saponaria officinalis TaxID=3572 RepID=A0AAW1H0V7_SAPOF